MLKHCLLNSAIFLAIGCGAADNDPQKNAGPYPDFLSEYQDYSADGTGEVGESMNAFVLTDQHGDELDFRQLLGFVTVIDVGAVWCVPCQQSATTAQALQDELGDQSWVVQVLVQDATGGPPGIDDAEEWADRYGLELPVLADELQENLVQWAIFAWPTAFIVAPDGEILVRSDGALTDEQIVELTRDALQTHASELRK